MPTKNTDKLIFSKFSQIYPINVWLRRFAVLLLLVSIGWVATLTYVGMWTEKLLDQAQEQIDQFAFEPGIALLRRAISLEPNHDEAHLLLANTYRTLALFRPLERSQFEQLALEQYTLSFQANPYSAYIPYQTSLLYSEQKRYAEALPFVQHSLVLDPNNAGYWLEKGRLLEGVQRLGEARSAYRESQNRVPNAEARVALERLQGFPQGLR